jgi:hypothetical protein
MKRWVAWMGSGVVAAAAVITLAQKRMAQEPSWLERMNEFEHFVFHFALVMGGLIVGATGLAVVLYSTLRRRDHRNRRGDMSQALNKEGMGRLKKSYLIAIAVADLSTVTVILVKRHFLEPLWLTNLTPFEHFVFHVGLIAGGLVLGAASSGILIWSLFDLLQPFSTGSRRAEPRTAKSLLIRSSRS